MTPAASALRALIDQELAAVIDRLLMAAAAEAEAAVAVARADHDRALAVATADLQTQTRRVDELTESSLQLEIQLETVRGELEASAVAAQAAREQVAVEYETQLQLVRTELETTHVHCANLERKVQREVAERSRIVAALRTVQQACAEVEDTESSDAQGEPVVAGHAETPAPGSNEQEQTLELVAAVQPARKDPPPELVGYLKELFDQMESTYWLDHRAHASIEVVDRLGANLRYAHEAFLRRAGSDVEMGADAFGCELMARMDAHGADSLGRHLAIASYELPDLAPVCAPAS